MKYGTLFAELMMSPQTLHIAHFASGHVHSDEKSDFDEEARSKFKGGVRGNDLATFGLDSSDRIQIDQQQSLFHRKDSPGIYYYIIYISRSTARYSQFRMDDGCEPPLKSIAR
jgi:hypothetical protein